MKIVFSPSKTKTLCDVPRKGVFRTSITAYIAEHMTKLELPQIAKVLRITEDKARMVQEFFMDLQNQPVGNSCESYEGIAFKYLDWKGLDQKSQDFGDSRVVILSGLYGIVEPNSPISDYRLDIGDRIGKVVPFVELSHENIEHEDIEYEAIPKQPSSLYELWQPAVDAYFQQEDWVLNLASKEYAKMIHHPRMVTIEFWESKDGVWKQMSTSSKMMRGTMGHYILAHQVETVQALPLEIGGFTLATDVQGIAVPTQSMTIRYERVTE